MPADADDLARRKSLILGKQAWNGFDKPAAPPTAIAVILITASPPRPKHRIRPVPLIQQQVGAIYAVRLSVLISAGVYRSRFKPISNDFRILSDQYIHERA